MERRLGAVRGTDNEAAVIVLWVRDEEDTLEAYKKEVSLALWLADDLDTRIIQ
jgi:hypothetical protein